MGKPQDKSMEEHRKAPRRRTFLKGEISFNNRGASVVCVVRDLSDKGARLSLPGSMMLPDHFELRLPHRDETLECTLSWRRGDEVGVAFAASRHADPHDHLPPDVARKMRELEAEVLRLRRLIEELKAEPDKISVLLSNTL